MGLLGDLLEWMAQTAIWVLTTTGYAGLFLLMAAESMVFPVPSEAVMPFAGLLVATGEMGWTGAILASSAGSVTGSLLGYWMGRRGLLPLVERYGRYVLVQPHHLHAAEEWFRRRGTIMVFVARFVPAVRHVSSIPAGSARMPLAPFIAATLAGATLWNVFLLWLGYRYGVEAAEAVKPHLDVAGLALLLLVALYLTYEIWRGRRLKTPAPGADDPPH